MTSLAEELDEETRGMILKKTWCHGQLILPVFSVWYAYLFSQTYAWAYLYAAMVLPAWSWFSFKAITRQDVEKIDNVDPELRTLLIGGAFAESAHASVLIVSCRDLSTSTNMILLVASSLFLVETAAFLVVVGMCGGRRRSVVRDRLLLS